MFKNLIQISDLNRTKIETLIALAESLALNPPEKKPSENRLAALLFYENSTRTRISFELAADRVGIKTINLDINTSSVKKDESILDTIQTLGAMGCQYFVIRHSESGILEKIVKNLGNESHYGFINAGDGQHAHPTQGLLDMLTIYQHKKDFSKLRVGILGDSIHSRVAKSDIAALQCLGCQDIRLIGPKEWVLPADDSRDLSLSLKAGNPVKSYNNINALEDLDVIITLRVQKERMSENDLNLPIFDEYIQPYQLTSERVKLAKPDVIVMHPGPMNRGIEIASEVADGPHSVILKQVHNGVLMRMAIWEAIA